MRTLNAQECRAQAKLCREIANRTDDPEIEKLRRETADDLERQAALLPTINT